MPHDPTKPGGRDTNASDSSQQGSDDATVLDDATILDPDLTEVEGTSEEWADTVKPENPPAHPGRIGHFTIIDMLGEGGMGAVYLAEQKDPVERKVALKLVHASLRSPEALARFNAERQAMARLSHPNIAALFEAGATDDGFPYFAMENVPGDTLVRHCDANRLDIETRLQLFSQVCSGVQHAHQKGIMHRDLKPSNLLVAEVEGEAIPKIIDFGIAKALDEPLTAAAELTGLRAIGTPDYMSPEALAGDPDLDTRTDIYSLGVVLYELLTGSKPNRPVSAGSSMRVSTTWVPAIRPSTRMAKLDSAELTAIAKSRNLSSVELKTRLGGDLDWIVMKAIAEEPGRRYSSAAEFVADIARHLAYEPVLARPPSTGYRMGRFVRRNRLAVAAGSLVVLALVLGIVGTTLGLLRARVAEADARLEAQRAEQVSGFMTGLFAVSDPGEARGNNITARELLDRGARQIERELGDQPLLKAHLMSTMGDVYNKLGLYDTAVPIAEQVLQLRTEILGPDTPEVAEAASALGEIYRQQGLYAKAADMHQQALDVREAYFGPLHVEVAKNLSDLALIYWYLDRPGEAEAMNRRALGILENLLGSEHGETVASLHRLAWLLTQDGRYQEAVDILTSSISIRERTLGEDHYLVADGYRELAQAFTLMGNFEAAGPLLQKTLDIQQRVLDTNHPDIGFTLLALGRQYRFQHHNEEAVDMFQRAMEQFENSLGPDHYEIANLLNDLGLALADMGRWDSAESAYRRQLAIYEATLPAEHELIGQSLNNLGWVLSDGLQHYTEGAEILRRAVIIFEAGDPEDYWNALSRWSLANNLRDQDLHAQAEPYFEQALGILERTGGANRVDNPDLDQLVADYAKSLRAAGREQDALALELRFSAAEG